MIFRRFVRSPALTTAALLAVALGVGANAAILSVVDATRLRPLPFDDASALVRVWMEAPPHVDPEPTGLTAADLIDLRAEAGLFAALAGWTPTSHSWEGVGTSEVVPAAAVTAGLFSGVLRVQPFLGRAFLPEEDRVGASPTVLLGHGFWMEHFGGDPSAIGRAVALDGVPHVVVGVMPAGFEAPFRPGAALWTPARLEVARCRRECPTVEAVGRLAPGTSLPVARDRATALGARLTESYPETNAGVVPALAPLRDERPRLSSATAALLLGSGALVLVIACVNVGLLLLARGHDRGRELRIRRSVGASGRAITRQLLHESLVLALVGGAMGTGVAVWTLDGLVRAAPSGLFAVRPELDLGVLGGVFVLTTAAGLAFGWLPAVAAARWSAPMPGRPVEPGMGLGRQARRALRGARGGVGALQLGIALSLAVVAGGLLQGLEGLTRERLGFEPEHLLIARVGMPTAPLGTADERTELVERLVQRVAEVPGVFSVGAAGSLPLDEAHRRVPLRVEDDAPGGTDPPSEVQLRVVSPAYFYAIGQRLVEGRWFHPEDGRSGTPVVILGATAARRLFREPPRSPVGSKVALGEAGGPWRTVVGVVRDEWEASESRPAEAVAYVPLAQAPPEAVALVVRVDGDPQEVVAPLRAALVDVDPELRAGVVEPMAARVAEVYAAERFGAVLATGFALLALLLSSVGLFGILAHGVVSRLRELGLRRAFGATDDDLRRRVLARASAVAGAGLLVGAVGTAFFTEGLEAALTGSGVRTPLVYAAGVTAMALAVLLASAWPVRRSAAIEPASALRSD